MSSKEEEEKWGRIKAKNKLTKIGSKYMVKMIFQMFK